MKLLMRHSVYISFISLLFFTGLNAHAQEAKTITGIVTDAEKGDPVIGATVRIKGTQTGTATDVDGKFSLAASPKDVLVISSVGFKAVEMPVGSNTRLAVKLSFGGDMEEVVVVGYGTQKKATLTGAVATVDAKVFKDRGVVSNPLAALQGQVPGVVVTRTSAAPGREGWNFQMRGATSTNGADPLVIVDGIPLISLNALNSINPNDIESMSFLKDASAAIYGARAAGGVVLITSKRAASGKPFVQYDGSLSFKRRGLRPRMLEADHWGDQLLTALTNGATVNLDKNFIWYRFAEAYENRPDSGYIDLTKSPNTIGFGDVKDFTFFDTNMMDILWGNATASSHNLSVSARNEKMGFRLSLGYQNDGSLLKWGKNSSNRYNFRMIHDYTFNEKLKIETILSMEKNDIIQPTRIGAALFQFSQPGFPVATKNGKPYGWGTQYPPNWQLELGGENKEYNNRIFASIKTTYDIAKHLKFIGQVAYNWNATDVKEQAKPMAEWYNYAETAISSAPNPSEQDAYYDRRLIKDAYYNLNGYLEYKNKFADKHDLGVTLGANYERDEFNAFNTRTRYLANTDVPSLNLGLGSSLPGFITNGEAQSHFALGSYFSRLTYGYKDKYLFDVNARYDGTSKFDPTRRWKLFYGFQAAWRIKEEAFLKNVTFLDELKLRASWATLGNQSGIGLYDYIQLLNVSSSGGPGSTGFPILGANPAVLVQPTNTLVSLDRAWEKVQSTNIGLDIAVLKNRLYGSFEYFVKKNVNMLLGQTYSALLGAAAPASNIGELKTWGWEMSLNYRDHIGGLNFSIGGSLTDNNNKLIKYGGANLIGRGLRTIEGYPIGSYFGLEYAGRVQDEKTRVEYNKLAPGNNVGIPLVGGGVRLGDNMFKDQNGDGKITDPEDVVYLGRNDPRYVFGVNMYLDWKGIDFSAIFQGVGKRTIFRDGAWRVPFGSIFQGQTDFWLGKTWTPENPGAYYPKLSVASSPNPDFNTYNYQISSWSMENGAYIRLKNIVVGYTLPQELTKRAKIERLRVYWSGSDLWEWSKIRDGWDPEQTNTISGGFQRYPFYRTMNVGLNVTF